MKLVWITSKNPKQKKRDGSRDSHVPEWFEEFTDNLEDTEVLASALRKWSQNIGSIVFVVTFEKTEVVTSAWELKLQPPLAGDALAKLYFDSMKDVNQENNLRYAVVVQDLATQDSILSVQNKDFTEETEKSVRKFLEPSHKPNVIYTDNSLEFANLVKIYDGIIDLQHLIDPRHMALLKEPYEEWKKELQQHCYNQAWMKNVVADSMECFCHLRKVQDLLADGKAPYEGLFGEPFEGPIFCLEQWCWMSSDFSTRSINTSSIWQDNFTRNLS